MKSITILREQLAQTIYELTQHLQGELLYRGLGSKAEEDYRNKNELKLYEGNMSVGCGVFFTNNQTYAANLAQKTLLITTQEELDPDNQSIDTRIPGYDEAYKQNSEGENLNGWKLWERIQEHDTITRETEDEGTYIYARRTPVMQEEILLEINLI